jgi:hypothetical protein
MQPTQLRPFLAVAAVASIALATYACSDSTFPSTLPVFTPLDGGGLGLADVGVPAVEAGPSDGGEAGSLADGGDAGSHADAGDAGGHAADGGDASIPDAEGDAPSDAPDDGG